MALTDKQEMFCREYLIDLNATQAAIRAGYSAKTANRAASENMSKPDIQSRITELKAKCNEDVSINAQYVLNRLVEIDQMDVLDILSCTRELKPVAEWRQGLAHDFIRFGCRRNVRRGKYSRAAQENQVA